jgi:hypothetical protein
MAVEAASADAELATYLEVLSDLDDLHRALVSELSALESFVAEGVTGGLASDLTSCWRSGCLVRDRLHAATDTLGIVLQLVPLLDMMLLEAIRGAYQWAVVGLERARQLARRLPVPEERSGAGPTLRAFAEVHTLCAGARPASEAALSMGIDGVVDAMDALEASIERVERAAPT